MNRINHFLAVLTIAVWPVLSNAYSEVLVSSYELSVDEVTLPAHVAGQVVVNPCAECEPAIHPVNGDTTYHVGMRTSAVSLADLRAAVNDNPDMMVLVGIDTRTNAVARITLDTGE